MPTSSHGAGQARRHEPPGDGRDRQSRDRDDREGGDRPDAGTLAIAALSHFATDGKLLARFFALTGLDPARLREAAGTPGFTAGVLDFVLADERLLIALAAEQETTPQAIAAARASLDHSSPYEDDWPPRTGDDWA